MRQNNELHSGRLMNGDDGDDRNGYLENPSISVLRHGRRPLRNLDSKTSKKLAPTGKGVKSHATGSSFCGSAIHWYGGAQSK